MTNTCSAIAAAMARRSASGLKLAFRIPGRHDLFICYAKDEAQKSEWLAKAIKSGWTREVANG